MKRATIHFRPGGAKALADAIRDLEKDIADAVRYGAESVGGRARGKPGTWSLEDPGGLESWARRNPPRW